MKNNKQKNVLSRWEIVLLIVLTPMIYLALCYIVTSTEFDYPHRELISLFDSELMPYIVILGFDVLWLAFVKLCPLGNKRTKTYLTLLFLILSAVAITDIFMISMWRHMMA